jgi:hypothetical protein
MLYYHTTTSDRLRSIRRNGLRIELTGNRWPVGCYRNHFAIYLFNHPRHAVSWGERMIENGADRSKIRIIELELECEVTPDVHRDFGYSKTFSAYVEHDIPAACFRWIEPLSKARNWYW